MKIPNIKKCIFIIFTLVLIECALVGYIGWWRSPFWEAVNNRDLYKFIEYIIYFSVAALSACFTSSYSVYIQQYTALLYRYKLTRKAFKLKEGLVEGQEQRVQEDCFTYPALFISLFTGGIKNIILLVVFMGILLYQLNVYYLILPLLYVFLGTLVAAKLAKPLVNLNYINQVFEAKFRKYISKLNYSKVHRNNYNLFKITKHLGYFQYFYNQITVIVPYLILAPVYFSAAIVFGVFMQCASSMNQIIDCLSYIINSFNDINKFLSCKKRLKELELI